jgi:hypothetical protein
MSKTKIQNMSTSMNAGTRNIRDIRSLPPRTPSKWERARGKKAGRS